MALFGVSRMLMQGISTQTFYIDDVKKDFEIDDEEEFVEEFACTLWRHGLGDVSGSLLVFVQHCIFYGRIHGAVPIQVCVGMGEIDELVKATTMFGSPSVIHLNVVSGSVYTLCFSGGRRNNAHDVIEFLWKRENGDEEALKADLHVEIGRNLHPKYQPELQQHFHGSVGRTEVVLHSFRCALNTALIRSGRLYITQDHLCFNCSIPLMKVSEVIKLKDITRISKGNTSVRIITKQKKEGYYFSMMGNRDAAFFQLRRVWLQAMVNVYPPPKYPAAKQAELVQLWKQFSKLDTESSGMVSKENFVKRIADVVNDDFMAAALFNAFDKDNNNTIEFSEFLRGMRVMIKGNPIQKLELSFMMYDENNDNFITVSDFIRIHSKLDSDNGNIETKMYDAWSKIASDGSKKVDLEKFTRGVVDNPDVQEALGLTEILMPGSALSQKTDVIALEPGIKKTILVGIEKAVQRCQTLTTSKDVDFDAESEGIQTKFECASKTYKITDWAPRLFKRIREQFGVTDDVYLQSLGHQQLAKNVLKGAWTLLKGSATSGRSGAFFLRSFDSQFLIKSCKPAEYTFLQQILPEYYKHVKSNPDTLIARFYQLAILKEPSGNDLYFVVMENILPNKKVQALYDLKGSTVGRSTPVANRKPGMALKDLDFLSSKAVVKVPPRIKGALHAQIEKDAAFLSAQSIIDYSVLLGISIKRAKVVEISPSELRRSQSVYKHCRGGMESTDGKEVYYFGVIDILTPWGFAKKSEHALKSIVYEKDGISVTEPGVYKERFVEFMTKTVFK